MTSSDTLVVTAVRPSVGYW